MDLIYSLNFIGNKVVELHNGLFEIVNKNNCFKINYLKTIKYKNKYYEYFKKY